MKNTLEKKSHTTSKEYINDRLWLEHFAHVLHGSVFTDEEYRKLLRLIDRELEKKYKK